MAGLHSEILFHSRRETKLLIPVTCISRYHPIQLNGLQTNKHGLWWAQQYIGLSQRNAGLPNWFVSIPIRCSTRHIYSQKGVYQRTPGPVSLPARLGRNFSTPYSEIETPHTPRSESETSRVPWYSKEPPPPRFPISIADNFVSQARCYREL